MNSHLKIEGIYDKRTLILLKKKGLKDFGFDFSPKSFNFIQEHIFLNELIPVLDLEDTIHLHFTRSDDPMIKKVIKDLLDARIDKKRLFLDCDEWADHPGKLEVNYFLHYYPQLKKEFLTGEGFKGLVLDFRFLEELHLKGLISQFISNFYTQFNKILSDKNIVLKVDWDHNLFPSLFEYFEFDLLSLAINSKIEVCYRNVDLGKLNNEVELVEKMRLTADKF